MFDLDSYICAYDLSHIHFDVLDAKFHKIIIAHGRFSIAGPKIRYLFKVTHYLTVLPAMSDSDVVFCLQL